MAYVTMNPVKLKSNFEYLNKLFIDNNIRWSVVSKLLCGNVDYLKELLSYDIQEICDSRITNLKIIKSIRPDISTIYIKPPARNAIKDVISYSDISMNTELSTIKMLNNEAKKQDKVHKIIIMIEMGELREGIIRDDILSFYSEVYQLSNIEVVGIGTNLTCLYGILPNHDKLIQLSLFEQLIEAKFNTRIEYVSGGSSVTIPLLMQNLLPKGINHFRVGESLFLGTDVYNDTLLQGLESDIFILYSEIIELIEKPVVPMGEFGTNVEGDNTIFDENLIGTTSNRAIIDIGLLDVDQKQMSPIDETIQIVGGSSDMFVIDLGDNPNNYKVGDRLAFRLNYLGTVRVLNSKYIEKRIAAVQQVGQVVK
jgi:ornithine racemase